MEDAASAGARVSPRGTRVAGMVACTVGVVLVALAVPRLTAGLIEISGDPVKRMTQRGVTLAPGDLKRFVLNRHDAAAWSNDARLWIDVGMAYMKATATTSAATERDRRRLAGAAHAFDRALALSPANGIAWMRLGEVRLRLIGPSSAAAEALEMSIRMAPYQRESLIHRLELLFRTWRYLGPAGREAVAGQVRMAQRDRRLAPKLAELAGQPAVGRLLGALLDQLKDAPSQPAG